MAKGACTHCFLEDLDHLSGTKHYLSDALDTGFFLVGFFIWLAENIATFFNAWKYPDQNQVWHVVSVSKISSWFLLVIISVIIVAQLKHVKANRNAKE